jgi:hypothetical protein
MNVAQLAVDTAIKEAKNLAGSLVGVRHCRSIPMWKRNSLRPLRSLGLTITDLA